MYKALFISTLSAACALGQSAATAQKGAVVQMGDMAEFAPVGITTTLAGPMSNITGAPYSAQPTTERVQMLADGNRIVQTTTGSIARDAQGRVRREESLPGFKTSDGEPPRIVMIDDPVAHVHWTLDAQTKTAMKMPLPSIRNGAFGVVTGRAVPGPTNLFFASADAPAGMTLAIPASKIAAALPNDTNVVRTDLGMRSVEGVPAQGTRITRTIPAGQFGNEMPMIISTETWYSPDLKLLVTSKSSDPRMGDTTYTLSNIQRSEPAASLFQIPDDYTVKDMPGPTLQIKRDE